MPGVDFQVLRSQITMSDVLNQLGFEPTGRSGSQLRGPCPVHGSGWTRSRTFSVNLMAGRYDCHKCHSHGNALELWAAVHKLPIYEAAVDLCRVLGRQVPWIDRWPSPRDHPREEAPVLPRKHVNDSTYVST